VSDGAPDKPQTIDAWRQRIDELNESLLQLLSERAGCALEVGRLKKAEGKPIYAPDRESAVMERLKEINNGPLSNDAVLRIFRSIIDETLRMERDDTEG
jgi:chorismate mutase-like protein